MLKVLDTTTETEETPATPTLDDLAREGARRMLMAALQVEVAQYVDAYQEARDARGRRLVVRHGQAEARKVTCGAGTVEVRAPRVNDKRVDATGQRERFTSLSTSCRDHAAAVAAMARRSIEAHRGRGIRAPTRVPGKPGQGGQDAVM